MSALFLRTHSRALPARYRVSAILQDILHLVHGQRLPRLCNHDYSPRSVRERVWNRNIVAISFTALILNELIMVALEITIWYVYMITSEAITLGICTFSMVFLPEYFDLSFVVSTRFGWKVAVIVAVSGD